MRGWYFISLDVGLCLITVAIVKIHAINKYFPKGIEFLPQTQIFYFLSLQTDGVYLWLLKRRLFDLTEYIVWNIKGLIYRVAKKQGLGNKS